jgi:hypothetical protein
MKTKSSKHELTFGSVIEHYCGARGTRKAGGFLQLLIKAELAGFDRRNRETSGRGNGKA